MALLELITSRAGDFHESSYPLAGIDPVLLRPPSKGAHFAASENDGQKGTHQNSCLGRGLFLALKALEQEYDLSRCDSNPKK